MKASYCLTALILAASLGAAHAQSAIEAVSKRFTDTYATKDASDLASFYTKDASVFSPTCHAWTGGRISRRCGSA